MSAQTAGRDPGRVGSDAIPVKCPTPLDVAAAVTIYGGSLVFVNSSGRAVTLSPDQTMTCAGYAESDVDNATGSNGTLTITPRIGCISLVNGSGADEIAADDVNKMAYASDNQTANLTSSSSSRCAIGPILGMDGTRVFVLAGYPLNREIAGYVAGIGSTVQAWDADLDALAAMASTAGMLAKTAAATFAVRTLTAPAAGFTITNPAGTAGNPTFVLADDLAALEALDATAGIIAKTAADTYARRTLQAPAAGFTITNPAGTAGDPTFVLANGLAALEALASTGLVAHTAGDTYSERTITGTASQVLLSNGNGVSGNPTISLGDYFVLVTVINAVGGTGGATAGTLAITVTDLNGAALTRAVQLTVRVHAAQYSDGTLLTSVTFSAAGTGSIIASGSGYAVIKTNATGAFSCALSDASDETAYLSCKTADAVSLIADACCVVGSVVDDAVWSA